MRVLHASDPPETSNRTRIRIDDVDRRRRFVDGVWQRGFRGLNRHGLDLHDDWFGRVRLLRHQQNALRVCVYVMRCA